MCRTTIFGSLSLSILLIAAGESTSANAKEPEFRSDVAAYDEAYLKAIHTIAADIKAGKFMAGESWDQVWTRDTSYSVDLACGLLHPEVSKTTLTSLVEEVDGIGSCWYQDKCGHFGGWPALTDAIVGATGAWSLYEFTGDRQLLAFNYKITVNSLKRAERDVLDEPTGLFKGCSTFMESNSGYPKKYESNGALLAKTKALSTNLLYYNGYRLAARMGRILNKDFATYESKANKLKEAINKQFWLSDKGYYSYFQDEHGQLSEAMEGTGEAFAILFDVASTAQKRSILKNTPVTPYGIPSLWPQYPEWTNYNTGVSGYYHNGMIWPFVQGYWAWAATKSADLPVFERELNAVVHLSQANDTFMEFYRPEQGLPDGSRRQLWSASGYLSMIYHGLFGMNFEEDGIHFAPMVPPNFTTIRLTGVAYRGMTLDLQVLGHGSKLTSFKVDGVTQDLAVLPANLTGRHSIAMDLN